jgi:hypothetical protein
MSKPIPAAADFPRTLFDARTAIEKLLDQIAAIQPALGEKSPGDARELERLAAHLKPLSRELTRLVERFEAMTDATRWWMNVSRRVGRRQR